MRASLIALSLALSACAGGAFRSPSFPLRRQRRTALALTGGGVGPAAAAGTTAAAGLTAQAAVASRRGAAMSATAQGAAAEGAVAVPAKDPLLLRAARGEQVERVPVWMMRQAGRHMAAYRDLVTKHPTFRERSEVEREEALC
jgi:uroporphyrinogen decarboxylase